MVSPFRLSAFRGESGGKCGPLERQTRIALPPQKSTLSQAAAKGILTLEFNQIDKDRMHFLAAKARAGELTSDEEREVEAYSRVSSLLGILKSKARRALKYRQTNGKAKTH
jgi:hypothetical protein